MKHTAIYTYYDNPDALKRLIDYHTSADLPETTFMIIDDGSPNRPLSLSDLPDDWRLTRITEDIGWNAEGARNLGMHVTNTEWNTLTDIDTNMLNDGLKKLADMELDPMVGYQPRRQHDRRFKNSWVISKTLYWTVNGYDETFTGLYGYDFTLGSGVKRLGTWSEIPGVEMGSGFGGAGGKWTTRPAKSASNKEYHAMLSALAAGELEYTDERLRFPWQTLR